MKKKFTIRITNADRLEADHFSRCDACLCATALKRRGAKHVVMGVISATIDGQEYLVEPMMTSKETLSITRIGPPFYHKSIVGKRITFTRE